MAFFRALGWLYSGLLQAMMAAASIYLGLMMVAIIYFASFRAAGWTYTPFAFTFVEFGFMYVLMLGTPWMVRTRGHVFIELLTAAVSPRVRNVLSRVVAAACVLVCLLLAYYTGKLAWSDYVFNEYDQLRADMDIPRWIVSGAMPVGFGLMAVEFLFFVVSRETLHTGAAGVVGEDA